MFVRCAAGCKSRMVKGGNGREKCASYYEAHRCKTSMGNRDVDIQNASQYEANADQG